jgi:hypothetical protein
MWHRLSLFLVITIIPLCEPLASQVAMTSRETSFLSSLPGGFFVPPSPSCKRLRLHNAAVRITACAERRVREGTVESVMKRSSRSLQRERGVRGLEDDDVAKENFFQILEKLNASKGAGTREYYVRQLAVLAPKGDE